MRASGSDGATALGHETTASGEEGATALGDETNASGGNGATALGYFTAASGARGSTALSDQTTASGGAGATALGFGTMANSLSETVIGSNNDIGTGQSANLWVLTDRLFEIGNANYGDTRHNAITVLKNGNTGLGITNPYEKLTVLSNDNTEGTYIATFYANNLSQGLAVGYNTLQSIGTNSNVDLKLKSKGNGLIEFHTNGIKQAEISSQGNFTLWGLNNGAADIGFLRFGNGSGEGIASKRTAGAGTNQYGLDFYTATAKRMSITNGGFVGIGLLNPANLLEVNGIAAKPGGGSWAVLSDQRLKQNIKPFNEGLSVLKKIHPVWYQYNIKSGYDIKPLYVGIIGQDLEKVAPYMISKVKRDSNEYLQVDNSAMMYILINAAKELGTSNDSLKSENKSMKAEISTLKSEMTDLKSMILLLQQTFNKCNPCSTNVSEQQSSKLILINNASLEQNIPNPFNHTTTINYILPQTYSSAKIVIVDKAGKTMKEINISGNGKGSIKVDASTLASGAYNYSLYTNGKLIATKQMMLSK